jgi:CheY-like chemotaxis protein
MDAGRMNLRLETVRLSSLLEVPYQILSADAQAKDLRFTTQIDPALPEWVIADAGRIRQALLNFGANAIKFTSAGTVSITASLDAPTGRVLFRVCDTGIGIAPDDRKKLFLPFSQIDNSDSRQYGGTGLGLSICKRLVELMGGEIGVDSQLGVGSTFWFRLPLEASTAPAPEPGIPVPAHSRTGVGGCAHPILVVEDNAVNRRVAVGLVQKLGYPVEAVCNGKQAVDRVASSQFALILMDCQMPVMDGFEATRLIREMQTSVRTPIIAVTARAMREDERASSGGIGS